MRIAPIMTMDIIGRYQKTSNKIIDTFTNKVIVTGKENKIDALYKEINKKALLNADILDFNAKQPKNKKAHLLYVVV